MAFSATKEARQQSPVTLNQLRDCASTGAVVLSCLAVGAICSASCPCYATFPYTLCYNPYKYAASFQQADSYLICCTPCVHHGMEVSLLAPPALFIQLYWVISCSKLCSEEIIYSAVKADMHSACVATSSAACELNLDGSDIWMHEHICSFVVGVKLFHGLGTCPECASPIHVTCDSIYKVGERNAGFPLFFLD